MSLIRADARCLPLVDGCVQTCVTSPPYFGLRDYGSAKWVGGDAACDHMRYQVAVNADSPSVRKSTLNCGTEYALKTTAVAQQVKAAYKDICGKCGANRIDPQIGLEPSPDAYVQSLLTVFAEVWRVLKDDGTVWLNLGDSYTAGGGTRNGLSASGLKRNVQDEAERLRCLSENKIYRSESVPGIATGVKPKDLLGIPWRVAFALQAAGWVLRQEIIWAKANPMPESVTDRCTKSHEQIFMFAKGRWSGPAPGRFASISDEDARWLALFLDTEGNIAVKRVERNGRLWFGAQICFAGTHAGLLDVAKNIIGAGTVLERAGHNAPMYYLQLSNRQAAALLHRLYPFLIVKHRQARIAMHIQTLLRHRGGRDENRRRTDAEVQVLESLWLRNKSCNRFGEPDLSDVPEPKFGKWADCERYYYDAQAIQEPDAGITGGRQRAAIDGSFKYAKAAHKFTETGNGHSGVYLSPYTGTRNKRSVWHVATQPYSGSHFATFPEALIEPCILAGSRPGDLVLDPFIGSGTVGAVCERFGRRWVGTDLSYQHLSKGRTQQRGLRFLA